MNRPADAGNNIDQVRDILFGTQMREYSGRLDRLESELSSLRSELHERIDQNRNTVMIELRALQETLEKRLKSLDHVRQEEAESIRQSVGRVGQKLSTSTQQLDEALNIQVAGVRRDLLESKDMLHDAMRTLRTQMTESLEQHVTKLQGTKVSRDDMAEALMELALRLKGTDLIPELSLDPEATADSPPAMNGQ